MTTLHRPGLNPDLTLAGITFSLAGLGFELRRSWPRAEDHLLLDLQPIDHPEGEVVAAQWFRDVERARSTEASSPGSIRSGRFVLQPGGADRKLRSLRGLLADPETELVSHRPERRAVLRHRGPADTRYTKVVAVRKLPAVVVAARAAEALPLLTPRVRTTDPARGTVTTWALPGLPLHELLNGPRAEAACVATGAALAALHRVPLPAGLAGHGWSDELAVTDRWRHLAGAFRAPLNDPDGIENADTLSGFEVSRKALIHRDFHDRQVLVGADDSVGILDFDLMAAGDPALDLANMLAHLDLRCRQRWVSDAAPLRAALLRGYQLAPGTGARVPGYEALARRRLAAVYAFRPSTRIT